MATKKVFLLFTRLYCYYHRLLRRSVHLPVLYSAIASQFTLSRAKGRTLVLPVRYSAFWIVSLLSVLIVSCNNQDASSPFDEILVQAPYSVLTDSIKKEPKRDDIYFRRAVLLNKNNFPEPALADFKTAWSLSKNESYAVAISNILIDKNKEDAISFLLEALKELPESIFLRLSLGRLYDEENKTDEALNACNTILEQQPDQVNTLMLKAELLQKKNDSAGSLAALEKAYQLAPGNLEVSYKLAYQYAENKNAKVIPLADSLIAKDSLKLHGEPYYIKGLYFSNIDDKTKALQLLNETTKRDYNYLNAYIEKSKILIGQKKINEALKTLQLANTISPAFPDAYYWIGKCQEELGQKEDAKLSYEKAYGLDKTFIEAKEAADNIK